MAIRWRVVIDARAISVGGHTFVNRLKRVYRRSTLRAFFRRVRVVRVPLDRAQVGRAFGIGLMVGVGMAAFSPSGVGSMRSGMDDLTICGECRGTGIAWLRLRSAPDDRALGEEWYSLADDLCPRCKGEGRLAEQFTLSLSSRKGRGSPPKRQT
jgi:hypothetical protein